MADAARTGSHVREQAALADYTTLRLGGPARRLVEAATEAEIVAAVRAADERGEPLLVLGGGSNLVVADEGFPGTVVRVATSGVHRRIAGHGAGGNGTEGNGEDPVELTVAAGEDWDAVVAGCVGEGLAGLECLSGIPGRTGATPIQNVGAYGQEVAERIISVRVYDRARRAVTDLASADCGFGYRTSAFKRSLQAAPPAGPAAVTGRFVVLSVRFLLVRDLLSAPVRYPELARALGLPEVGRAPLPAVRSAVLGLRRGKGMVLDPDDPDTRSVGSFFLNPVLDRGQFSAVERAARAVAGPGAQGGRPGGVRGGAGQRAGAGRRRALSPLPPGSAAVHALDLPHRDADGRGGPGQQDRWQRVVPGAVQIAHPPGDRPPDGGGQRGAGGGRPPEHPAVRRDARPGAGRCPARRVAGPGRAAAGRVGRPRPGHVHGEAARLRPYRHGPADERRGDLVRGHPPGRGAGGPAAPDVGPQVDIAPGRGVEGEGRPGDQHVVVGELGERPGRDGQGRQRLSRPGEEE